MYSDETDKIVSVIFFFCHFTEFYNLKILYLIGHELAVIQMGFINVHINML